MMEARISTKMLLTDEPVDGAVLVAVNACNLCDRRYTEEEIPSIPPGKKVVRTIRTYVHTYVWHRSDMYSVRPERKKACAITRHSSCLEFTA